MTETIKALEPDYISFITKRPDDRQWIIYLENEKSTPVTAQYNAEPHGDVIEEYIMYPEGYPLVEIARGALWAPASDPRVKTVTVHFFKPKGKWHATEEIVWTGRTDGESLIHEEFERSLKAYTGFDYRPYDCICIESPHAHSHPIQLKSRAPR